MAQGTDNPDQIDIEDAFAGWTDEDLSISGEQWDHNGVLSLA